MKQEPTTVETNRRRTVKLATMGMIVAISVVLVWLIHLPIIPGVAFLEYDPADIPIIIGTFAFGPLAGILLTVVTAVIQGLTVSAGGEVYGILMHIIATGTLVLVAGFIYKIKKNRVFAGIGLIAGVVAWVAVMIPANLLMIPLFMGVPVEAVEAMLFTAIIPFNVIKSGINATVVFLLYSILHKFIRGYFGN